jgi:hypothetical protein
LKLLKITLSKEHDLLLSFDDWMEEIDALQNSDNLRNKKIAYSTKHYVDNLIDQYNDLVDEREQSIKKGAASSKKIPPELRKALIKSLFPDDHESVLKTIEKQETSE